jgi:hypothetical protein
VRPDDPAARLLEILDRLHESRPRRIGMHVEDEELARLESCEPELAPIVGEAAVMRLVPALHRLLVDDLAVSRRARLHVHDDELVRPIAERGLAERPDIDKFLLSFDAGEVRRGARFIGARDDWRGEQTEGGDREDRASEVRFHGIEMWCWLR